MTSHNKRPPFAIALPVLALLGLLTPAILGADDDADLRIAWANDILTIHDDRVPGGRIETWYLEAYCRPGSTDRDWGETVIGHETELVEAGEDGRLIRLRCELHDGVVVEHTLTAGEDEVDIQITAHNPTDQTSQAHWAQPCVRLGQFTGHPGDEPGTEYDYLEKSFVFLEGELERMPTRDWATDARYTPGQVWAGPGVDRDDVNPRPLNPHVPTYGLIGAFSDDETLIFATAFEPYQELFQGIIQCLHSDFRIGGLEPGETKEIRGKMYIVENDIDALLARYRQDFPEQANNN